MALSASHQQRGKIGGLTTHGRHSSDEITRKARERFAQTFTEQADPDGVLPLHEVERRAASLRRAHFARLAFLSAKARAKRSKKKSTTADNAVLIEEGQCSAASSHS